jgi:hypothetical protein
MYVAPPMSHACSAFAVAAFLAAWIRVRRAWSPAGCAALAALAALMAMVREQDAFVAVGPVVDWVLFEVRGLRVADAGLRASRIRALAVRAAVSAVAFLVTYWPQLWAYTVLNGYPGPARLVARKMNWLSPHALDVLVSPRHGLFFWTPLVVLSLAGLVWLARGAGLRQLWGRAPARALADSWPLDLKAPATPLIARCLLLVFVSQVYVAGSVESWSVAGAFGQRRFLGLTVVFVVGLAALGLRTNTGPWRTSLAAVTAVAVWWNLALIAQFGSGLMDRQRLELGRNAYHAFVTIPARLPDLAYRYVFERRSFYKSPVGDQ